MWMPQQFVILRTGVMHPTAIDSAVSQWRNAVPGAAIFFVFPRVEQVWAITRDNLAAFSGRRFLE